MTVHHFTFLESFYDNLTSQSNVSSKKRMKKTEETCIRHWWKRVIVAISWHDLRNPNSGSLLHKVESWHDLLKSWHDWANFCAYLFWSLFWKQGLRFGESKVRFWDQKTARKAISSTFYQFMYVLIPILIMLFVNSIMSS